ncbi:MAG: VanW family protein [Patescibacteria group bacterium]|nr:MAG: VanW family protein [Patescibacteria group bacterium]
MKPAIKAKLEKFFKIALIPFSIILFLIAFFYFVFFERILPNTFVDGVNIGGLTQKEASETLKQKITIPKEIILTEKNKEIKINLEKINLTYNFEETSKNAYLSKKDKNVLDNLKSIYQKTNIRPVFSYNSKLLDQDLEEIKQEIEQKGQKPQAKIENGKVKIINGVPGVIIDKDTITKELEEKFTLLDFSPLSLKTISGNYVLSQEKIKEYEERVNKLLNKKLVIVFENYEKEIKDEEIISLSDYFEKYQKDKIAKTSQEIAQENNRNPQNPVFNFENGIVKEFLPAKDGITVLTDDLTEKIISAFEELENTPQNTITINLPVQKTPPEYKTEDVNTLGIKELVGTGKSKFVGSIPSRVHNIKLASSKFNGILIKPDEVFSFNQILGEVSAQTGYQQAYIIKEGQTVLGDGGGVCQVSTTLFRALLNAGLPIIERQAHAYRVSYYEQDSPPGFDATVFSPSPDLKFKNDTPAYLLMQTKIDLNNKTLIFEIYGTKDNREVYISKPVISNITPPPEDLYIDDPNLPAGQIKQIDWKAWGAKVWFDYKVTKNGEEIINKRFYSNYQPWQAKFLRGTKTQ